jgi:hypothetical protein
MRRRVLAAALALALVPVVALAPLPVEDRTTIHHEIVIGQPPDVVFAYVTTPASWPRWHPSSLAVSGLVDHSLIRGEQVVEDFLVAGYRGRAVWRVLARDVPRRWMIEGEVGGRRAGHVTYRLAEAAGGTRFEREFVYSSPNLLFSVLNRLRVRARVEAESAEAVRRLKAVLESAN